MIEIDGVAYNAEWKANSFEQTADIINGDNSGRLQGDKSMFLDYVGTFYNSSGDILRSVGCSDEEWDKLYQTLSNPINDHTVKVPFNQGYMTTRIYVSQLKRKLIGQRLGRNIWGKSYTVTFTAMESQWLAGSDIEGVY